MGRHIGWTRRMIGFSRAMRTPWIAVATGWLVALGWMVAPTAEAAIPGCTVAALSALGVPGVTIASAVDVAAAPPTPEYCRVLGSVASPSGNPNGDGFAL